MPTLLPRENLKPRYRRASIRQGKIEMNSVRKLQVLVAHAEPLVAAGLEATLREENDLDVSALTSPRPELTPVGAHELADVILADCRTGIRLALGSHPGNHETRRPRIVIVTQDESEVSVRRAIEAGVRGYLLLGATRDSVVQAVRFAARGGITLDPIAASRMAASLGDSITSREREVLGLVMLGLPDKVIANRLGIRIGTAKCHVKQLLLKLDASSRTEAAAIAQRRGLITPPGSDMHAGDTHGPHARVMQMAAGHWSSR